MAVIRAADVPPGDVVIAPAGRPHRFTNAGTGRLQMTSISPAGRTETTWLERR